MKVEGGGHYLRAVNDGARTVCKVLKLLQIILITTMVISSNVGSLVSMDVKDYVNPRKVFVASGENPVGYI